MSTQAHCIEEAARSLTAQQELRRLGVRYPPSKPVGQTDREYTARLGKNAVAFGRNLDSIISSPSYAALDDDGRKGALNRIKASIQYWHGGGLSDDAVDHNVRVKLEQHAWDTKIDRSSLDDAKKAELHQLVDMHLKFARVLANDRRKLSDVAGVFDNQKRAIDEWLGSQFQPNSPKRISSHLRKLATRRVKG